MNARTPLKTHLHVSTLLMALAFAVQTAQPANILFVSDNPTTGDNAFHPALVGFPDDFYVVMMQNAGHNVVRFNPPNSQNTLLTTAQLAAINTNDLIVISRSIGSGGFQFPQSTNWNTRVTKPMIICSPYLTRSDGGRLGWFGNESEPRDTTPPTYLVGVDATDPETAFLFDGIMMSGNRMVDSFDEPFERNTSVATVALVPGGKALAQGTFIPRQGGAAATGHFIAEFPAGTIVRTNADVLPAYRMFVAAGSRELSSIPLGAGVDNLTPAGEDILKRAIALALNNGVAPIDMNVPVGIETDPLSVEVFESAPVTFSVIVTGSPPRTVEWQRDIGDGMTFTNIPDATTAFSRSRVFLPKVTLADDGAQFRVVATNPFGSVTSQVATLTVLADTTPPTIVSVRPKWTMTNLLVTFSEPVSPASAQELFNYNIPGLDIYTVVLDGTGTNVAMTTSPQAPGAEYTLSVDFVEDLAETPNTIAPGTQVPFTAFVESRGFLVSELFTGITPTGTAVSLLTSWSNYPHSPNISGLVNISSNAPTSPNLDQYGGRLVGWVIPPVDGNYIFYIRGDDGTELRLNPFGADPAGLTMIAGQAGFSTSYTAAGGPSAPQALTGGQAYAIEALWKEGAGGDWMQFAWTPPWSANIEPIAGSYLQTYAPAEGVSLSITSHPQGASVEENRTVTFSVAADSTPANALRSYQWQKGDGAGGFTNALGAQYGPTFTTPLLKYPDDDGSQWRVIVYVPGGSATSDVATVTVSDDVTGPVALSAGSVDGLNIGVCFDELVDVGTAGDPFSYNVSAGGGGVSVVNVAVRPDGRTVVLTVEPPGILGAFSVDVNGVQDLAENPGGSFILNSTVVGLTGADLGTVAQRGTNWSCQPDEFEVIGGGADIWGTADTGHFASRSVTGDFDAKVRVKELTLTASTGGALIAKAGLMVRQTAANNSQTLWLLGNPPPPGRDIIEAGYRATAGGATAAWGMNETNIHMPDMWFRIARTGNTFDGYVSSNGVDWMLLATTNNTMPASLLLGAAVTAHNNVAGLASTGRFSNFSITQPLADLSVSQVASPSAVYAGSQITYTITVANGGPDTANLVAVANPVPAGTAHVSSSVSQGSCALAAGVVTCSLGSIASGGSATIILVVSTSAAGTASNTATVTSSALDPDPADNSSTLDVPIHASPTINGLDYDASAGTFSMSVQTVDGYSYRVQYKNQLTDAEWLPLVTLTGDGTVQTITDTGPLPPTRFYRILVE